MENNKTEETKEKSAEIKDFLVSVIGNAPIGIMTLNMGKITTVCNQSLLGILKKNVSSEEAINQPIGVFLKETPALLKAIDHAYLKGRQSFNMPMVSYEDRFLAIKARKIFDGMLFFVDDITERRKTEQQLTEEKVKDEAILGNIADGVVVVDKNGKVILINKAAEIMLGRKNREDNDKSIGKLWSEILRREDEKGNLIPPEKGGIQAALSRDATTTTHIISSYYYVRKDGTRFPVDRTISSIILRGEIIGAVDVFRDITELKKLEQAKDDFLNIATHDLRTPMAEIRVNTEMILGGDYGEIPSKFKVPLQDIDQSNLNLIKMVDDFLTVARMEKSKIIITPHPTDIVPILNSITEQIKPLVEKKGLKFDCEIPERLPQVMADPNKIPEVVNNLLDNAIKYTDKGSISLRVSVKEDLVVVAVTDTGKGIDEPQKKDLFKKYAQVGAEKRVAYGKGTGLGLGLYISRLIIESCKGKIWLESQLGKGSTFYFSLPIAKK